MAINARPVMTTSRIKFNCSLCGGCCKHVKDSVPLNPLGIYNLARYFLGVSALRSTKDFLDQYTEIMMIAENTPYPVVLLKTTGTDKDCIFLKDNRCSVQAAKPSTCWLYPFSVEPQNGSFKYYLCKEKPHHFTGNNRIKVGDWMYANFTKADREILLADEQMIREIKPLFQKLKGLDAVVMSAMQHYKLYAFDLDQPFLPQYRSNHTELMRQLRVLCW